MKIAEVASRIFVPGAKVRDYLLVPEHPQNQGKAHFFIAFGFARERSEELRVALLRHTLEHGITSVRAVPDGTRYTVEGELEASDGRRPRVRTAWQIDTGSDIARLITAVPLTKGRGSR